MDPKTVGVQQLFLVRAFRRLGSNVRRQAAEADTWRSDAAGRVDSLADDVKGWVLEHWKATILAPGVAVYVLLMLWFVVDALRGKVEGSGQDIVQTLTGGLIAGGILGLVVGFLVTGGLYVGTLLTNWIFAILAVCVLFTTLGLWVSLYALWQSAYVVGQFLLLVPLFGMFLVTRAIQLWRGIFYTCPSRQCSYRGLPAYVCPECGQPNHQLWPNLYGLLWHHCIRCDHELPTLDALGRRDLQRRCGHRQCGFPLLGRHSGRAPERLVPIVGGAGSGKTCYLHMVVREIISHDHDNDSVPIRGEIDDPVQEQAFRQEWDRLSKGHPPDKTVEVAQAFLMYVAIGRQRSQLYLYDAPGEEYESITEMTRQQYFPLIEGIVLLADPLGLAGIAAQHVHRGTTPLADTVASLIGTCSSAMTPGKDGKFSKRIAVVIAKADMPGVRAQIGDIEQGPISSQKCRQALVKWGASNAVRALEGHFESVEYFACSALGRDVDMRSRKTFDGRGLLDPLYWMLTGTTHHG